MRKNLLTLVLGFSLLFFGMIATKAEAFNRTTPPNSITSEFIKENRTEFNKKYAELKKLCEVNAPDYCQQAILIADIAADMAMQGCLLDMNDCQSWQDWAIGILNEAMSICQAQ